MKKKRKWERKETCSSLSKEWQLELVKPILLQVGLPKASIFTFNQWLYQYPSYLSLAKATQQPKKKLFLEKFVPQESFSKNSKNSWLVSTFSPSSQRPKKKGPRKQQQQHLFLSIFRSEASLYSQPQILLKVVVSPCYKLPKLQL